MDRDTNIGCCNMILWDMIMVFLVSISLLSQNTSMHLIFCIAIGFIITLLFIIIMNVPYLGIAVQLFCCYFWYYLFSGLLPINSWTEGDKAANIFCKLLLVVAILALHFKSFSAMWPDATIEFTNLFYFMNHEKRKKNAYADSFEYHDNNVGQEEGPYAYGASGNQYHNDTGFSSEEEEHYYYWEDQREDDYQNNDRYSNTYSDSEPENQPSHPFYGCEDAESLKQRYKKLVKAYHPDDGGNAESFKYLQNEYERLLKKYK